MKMNAEVVLIVEEEDALIQLEASNANALKVFSHRLTERYSMVIII